MENVYVLILFKNSDLEDFQVFSTWEKGIDYLFNSIDEVLINENVTSEKFKEGIERIKHEYRIKKRVAFPFNIKGGDGENVSYQFLFDSQTVL